MFPRLVVFRITTYYLLFSLLLACSPQAPTAAVFTATPLPPPTETQSAPTDVSLPTETPTIAPTLAPALGRPQYVIDLQLNYTAKAATVNQTITYPNWTGETLTEPRAGRRAKFVEWRVQPQIHRHR